MQFGILGPLVVRSDVGERALPGSSSRALLAVLLLHPNEPVTAERLVMAVFGDDASAGAVRTLRVHISRLRKALGDADVLATTSAGYRLRVGPGELDAERFDVLAQEGRRALAAGEPGRAARVLREALSLWRGPALSGLENAPFAAAEIARLEDRRLTTVEVSIEADLALGRHAERVGDLQRLTAMHPLRERFHGQLMLALYRSGRQAEALEAYRHARSLLVERLGIEPGPELRELQRAVLAQEPSLAGPPVPAVTASRATLPRSPTAVFGREADLGRVARMVREVRTRLVTLVGPGGVGKTRLASEVARTLAVDFRDGVRWVELASLSNPRDLPSAVARVLAVPMRESEAPSPALLRFLGERHVLLVLDSLEHLMEGSPLLGRLLEECPNVTVLATSREPTRMAGERLYPVRPLEVPTDARSVPVAELERYGAVAMLCDRVRARDPDFALNDLTAEWVLEVCRRLDGLPLALELAAGRLGVLSGSELVARLDHALSLLAGGARDAPERQRTLRATIDWSYRSLTTEERRAFARLGIFAAGATVAAAEVVSGASLLTLESLVSKSLIVRRDDRLVMFETLREYALEHLADDPDRELAFERLASWSLNLARATAPDLVRAGRTLALARLDAELSNALAAHAWALHTGRAELALAVANSWGAYWWHANRWVDGRACIRASLEAAPSAPPHARAEALLWCARLTGMRHQGFREDLQASLELFRACDDASGAAVCLAHMVVAEASSGHYERAAALSDEAVQLATQARDGPALAFVLAHSVAAATTYADATRRAEHGAAYLRGIGDLFDLTLVCSAAGYLGIADGRHREALVWLEEGLRAARLLESARSMFYMRSNQGLALLFLDELDDAAHAFHDALKVCRDAAAEDMIDEALLGLAAVAARRGDLAYAARLTGASHGLATPVLSTTENTIWTRLHDILSTARESYGREEWDRTAQHAMALTVPEATEMALAGDRSLSDQDPVSSSRTRPSQ